MKRTYRIMLLLLLSLGLCGCGNKADDGMDSSKDTCEVTDSVTQEENKQEEAPGSEAGLSSEEWEAYFKTMTKTKPFKGINDTNPIMTQRFGADPYACVYEDRVYFYMTADAFEYDAQGEIKENSYSQIRSINVVSTADMMNFTDHGSIQVAGKDGAAKWANNSWAPAVAWKMIDGKPRFFLYFANSGGGIGVLTSDSPVGPFTDPIGKELVSRNTPNCADVLWLFDPAVLVDEDGRAYLYFGGGVPQDRIADPQTGRVVELGDDMISLKGDPVHIDVPYLFEDSGIHKAGNKYYYTYCTNWQVDEAGTQKYGIQNAQIVSLESDNPMGPFRFKEMILENPGKYCGLYGNNHHCVFRFKDQWYITYHTRALEKAMGIEKGYRCTSIDEFSMDENGTIGVIKQTTNGRTQIGNVDAGAENSAVCMAMQAGLDTIPGANVGEMVLSGVDDGDFLKVTGVDFGTEGLEKFSARIRKAAGAEASDAKKAIQIYVDALYGEAVGYLPVTDNLTADFTEFSAALDTKVSGVHDLFFVFAGSGYELESWQFQ